MTALALLAAPKTDVPADQTTTYVLMAGSAVFLVYIMTRLSRKKKRRDPFEAPFRPGPSLGQQRDLERQMENLIVELSNMSRQMTAQLDTRAAKLEQLIEDADERIARLQVLNKQAPARPAFEMPRETPAATPTAEPARPVDVPPPEPEPVEAPPQHADVYRLADEGKKARDIAFELNRPSGEIELILALRPRG